MKWLVGDIVKGKPACWAIEHGRVRISLSKSEYEPGVWRFYCNAIDCGQEFHAKNLREAKKKAIQICLDDAERALSDMTAISWGKA